jgi:hypothetical protein
MLLTILPSNKAMSKKALINAAQYICFRLGVLDQAWKICDKSSVNFKTLLEAVNPHITRATEMVELGEETAMKTPDDINTVVYHEFGDDIGRFMREHSRVPNDEEFHALLVNVVFNVFQQVMTEVQKDSFKNKLQAMSNGDDD